MVNTLYSKIIKSKILKNIFNLSILQVISAILSLILIPLLARVLEPTQFGIVMLLHLITSYFIWFAEWGFSHGGTQQIASENNNSQTINHLFNQIYSSQISLTLIATIPLAIFLFFLSLKYDLSYYFQIILIIYFLCSSILPIWLLNGLEKVTFAIIVQIYPKILALIAVIFFIDKPEDFIFYFYALILGLLIAFIHVFVEIIIKYKINFKFVHPAVQLKKNFNYFIASFSKTLGSNLIPFILSLFISIELFGFYSLADRIKGACLIILNPIFQSVFPRMCKVVHQKEYYSYLQKYSFLVLLLISLISLGLILCIDVFINILVGVNYMQSALISKWLIPSIVLSSMVSILYYFILIPFDLHRLIMKAGIWQFLFVLSLSFPLIYWFQVWGAVITLTLSELFLFLFYFVLSKKQKLFS